MDLGKLDKGVMTPILETEKIRRAFEFAYRLHQNQFRSTGEPYINHPIRVSNYIREYKSSSDCLEDLIVAALLHDTIEDTTLTYYDLVEFFGTTVASLVMEVTTDKDLKSEVGKTRYLEIKTKNMSSWGLTLKLCDRLDNCSDLNSCSEEFRIRYINETLSILEYLTENRIINETQKRIVRDILKRLDESIAPDSGDLVNRLSSLREKVRPQKEKTLAFGRVVDLNQMKISHT